MMHRSRPARDPNYREALQSIAPRPIASKAPIPSRYGSRAFGTIDIIVANE